MDHSVHRSVSKLEIYVWLILWWEKEYCQVKKKKHGLEGEETIHEAKGGENMRKSNHSPDSAVHIHFIITEYILFSPK